MSEKTLMPTRKVGAGAVTGAVTTCIVMYLNRRGASISGEEALAINTLIVAIVQWLVPNRVATQEGEVAK